MNRYNPQRHHRRSIRMKGYDYGSAGAYFITLLCHQRQHLFGEISNGYMCLSELGAVAYNEWMHTADIRPNVRVEAFVIMPNHMHAILVIDSKHESVTDQSADGSGAADGRADTGRAMGDPEEDGRAEDGRAEDGRAEDGRAEDGRAEDSRAEDSKGVCDTPLRGSGIPHLRSPTGTVGAMVRGYKGAVSRQARELGYPGTVWHRNYHEHIIRNEVSFDRIATYIDNNIDNWHDDGFH